MPKLDPRTVCVIGAAQHTTRRPGPAPEPLDSWVDMAQAAAEDSGAPDALRRLESLQVMYCQSWPYDDPVGRLADRLGCSPLHRVYSGIGGSTPQVLVNETAALMLRGELGLALIVGAEALATVRAAKKAGERPAWSHRESTRSAFPLPAPHPSEIKHGVFQAWETFPLFDTARRARLGSTLEEYTATIGQTLAPLSRVAAANPNAWFPVERTPAGLSTPTLDNRLVGWPYTKREVAVMDVDMAAAVLLATAETADRLGVSPDRRTYLTGWAYAEDPANVAERQDMSRSAGMEVALSAALAAAGTTVDGLDAFDLYSCFASSVHFAVDALGMGTSDHRGLTVTGGLPFAGGPASGYLLHSIASMTQRLREYPGRGLVTGVGMHMSKHVAAVYGSEPVAALQPPDLEALQRGVESRQPRLPLQGGWSGSGTVAAYTVAHGRDGSPEQGLVVLDTVAGRALARVRDPELMQDMETRELVGQDVLVTTREGVNVATW